MNEKEQATETRQQAAPSTNAQQRMAAVDDGINLIELCYVLLRHSIAICICIILGAMAAFTYTYCFVPATYRATAKLYVVSASKDSVVNLSDLQLGTQLSSDYKELILGRTILEETAKQLNLNWSPGRLASAISITNPNAARILRITATTTDPRLSAAIANELAQQAIEYLPRIMACDPPNIAEVAIVPSAKSGPNFTQETLKGALAGAALAIGFFVLRFLMNDSIVSSDDVSKYLHLETLAVIPEDSTGDKNKKKRNTKHSNSGEDSEKRHETTDERRQKGKK